MSEWKIIENTSMMDTWARLVCFHSMTVIELSKIEYTIGRNSLNDIIINNKQVSSIHVKIKKLDKYAIITDYSLNGTKVNGKSTSETPSSKVTEIKILDFYFVLLLQDHLLPLINDYYITNTVLGSGGFSVVKEAIDTASLQRFACKIVNYNPRLESEIQILSNISHPNIVQIYDYFFLDSIYIITNKVGGGELFDRIFDAHGLSEELSVFFTFQICLALMYLHSMGICHRDIKAENILLESNGFCRLYLSDFGLSSCYASMNTKCGTCCYLAPEIVNGKKYGLAVDCWALGVLIYTMIRCELPFGQEDDVEQRIRQCDYSFEDDEWCEIGEDCINAIERLLVFDKDERMTIFELFEHPWISDNLDWLNQLYSKL